MLQSIRENIKGWGAWIIVIFLCVPFAFWGINQYFDTTAANAAATVNGEEIPVFQLDRAYQQRYQQLVQAFGGNLPPELVDEQTLRREQLEQLIMQELLRQKMRNLGFRAADEQVRETIRGMPVFQENGQFSPARYRQALLTAGRTPAAFEALLRQDISLRQLQQGVAGSAFATPREAALIMALEEQGRRHSAIVIPDETFVQQVSLNEADLMAYYEENQNRFLTKETVDIAWVELALADFAEDIEVTEEILRQTYEQRADQYASQEQRHARHILIEGDDEAARAAAAAALERIQSGEDFAAVAREVSDDPVSGEQGGDLGLIQRGQLEGAFEDALFAMQEGEVRGPVQTDFGFHIIKLEAIKAPELPEFETIREQLAADYRKDQARESFEEAAQRLAEITYRDDSTLETAADELGLEIHAVADVTRTAGTEIAAQADVRDAAFSATVLEEGRNSDPIRLDDDRALVLRVAEHHPATPKPFAEVEVEVREQLTAERATQLARNKAEEILERARAGEVLATMARTEGLAFRAESVTYRHTPDIGPGYAQALFSADYPADGATLAMTPVENNDFVVFRLTEVIPGRYTGLTASEQEARRRTLRQREATAATVAYLAEMRNTADININDRNSAQE